MNMSKFGKCILKIDGILFLFFIFAMMATRLPIFLPLNGKVEATRTLATMYPGLPTWWIPEAWPGLMVMVTLLVVGVYFYFELNIGKNNNIKMHK